MIPVVNLDYVAVTIRPSPRARRSCLEAQSTVFVGIDARSSAGLRAAA